MKGNGFRMSKNDQRLPVSRKKTILNRLFARNPNHTVSSQTQQQGSDKQISDTESEQNQQLASPIMSQVQNQTDVLSLLEAMDKGHKLSRESALMLTQITELSFNNIQVTNLPESIGHLSNLQRLYLTGTSITSIPESITNLKALQRLYLGKTRITVLPASIGNLESLQRLHLNDTPLIALPESIGNLKKLERIRLQNTRITNLPESIGQLSSLRSINLSGTKISALPNSIGQLARLQYLGLNDTLITAVPESVCQLPDLQYLGLCNLPITSLPNALVSGTLEIFNTDEVGKKRPGIYAANTKLPPEYFAGKEVLQLYFGQKEKRHLQEAKIVLLGDGSAGKTYTVNRFVNNGKLQKDVAISYSTGQTHGVRCVEYKVPKDIFQSVAYTKTDYVHTNDSIYIHFWDFGGQETDHAMHQCFLTEDTVYVLMISSRNANHTSRLRYWLNCIRNLARGTTVMIVINIYDNEGTADYDRIELEHEFYGELNLDFHTLSVKDSSQEQFQKEIMQPIIKLAIDADDKMGLHPKSILRIRDAVNKQLSIQDVNYLSEVAFSGICSKEEITNYKGVLWLFTKLGICFGQKEDSQRITKQDFRAVKPIWITNALYAIIRECSASKGWVKRSDVEDCLYNPEKIDIQLRKMRLDPSMVYSKKLMDCDYILRIAEENELVFSNPNNSEYIFIPAKCQYKDRPAEIIIPTTAEHRVICEYRYRYLPETVLQKLMVDCMVEGMELTTCWRSGFIAKLPLLNCFAIVERKSDEQTLRLDIWSEDEDQPVKKLFINLRKLLSVESLDGKTQREKGLLSGRREFPISEYIVRGEDRFSVKRLFQSEPNEINRVVGDEGEVYRVADLLGAIVPNYISMPIVQNRSWQLFSLIQHEPRKEFERMCRQLFLLEFFDDDSIPIGQSLKNMPNHPGVEVAPRPSKKLDGKRISFQSKFFDSETNYSDIMNSAKKTVERYPHAIDQVYLYSNKDMTESCKPYQRIVSLLQENGTELIPVCNESLLERIDRYPELKKLYFSMEFSGLIGR